MIRLIAAGAATAVTAMVAWACTPTSTLQVTTPEDVLGLTTRIAFSTHEDGPTPSRSATLSNPGTSPIAVTDLVLAGQNPDQFALAPGQPKAFTIDPGGTVDVDVVFDPTSNGNKFGTLTIENNSTVPSFVVKLRGNRARGTVGNTEPQLSQLMQLFGYTTDVGFTTVGQATTRAPVGDEVIAPYFVRVDTSQPVAMTPIARYVAANYASPDNGRTPKHSSSRTFMYRFPPDEFVDDTPDDGTDSSIYGENQKTFPAVSSGTFTFEPSAPFGLYGLFTNYGDDRFNVDDNGKFFHNLRVYPAKGEGGAQIPDTWIIGLDVKTDPDKNFDYQDEVILLSNARPELDTGPAPESAATTLSFDSPVPATVVDKDGEGTGFTEIQPNKNGTESQPDLLDLTGGTLQITSTAAKSSGAENLQVNALQVAFDGSRTDSFAHARVLGPMDDLTSGFQQKAVYFGFDQDNYLKIEVEHRTNPAGIYLTTFAEVNGNTSTIGQVPLDDPSGVTTLDLGIVATLEPGRLRGVYRINDGDWSYLGPSFTPAAVTRFFSPQSRSGVLVSHTGSETPIVGAYDAFTVGLDAPVVPK